MVTSRFAQRIEFKTTKSSATVAGFANTSVSIEESTVSINMKTQVSDYSATFDSFVA